MIGNKNMIIEWLLKQPDEKRFEILEHRQKRSLTANAYAWALITKIADAVRLSKEDVYLNMLKHYGQSEIISVVDNVNLGGYFKYFEEIGRAELQGKTFIHYKIYKGSSEYDTREMAILIDGIIHECQNLEIETMPEHELEHLLEKWGR